MSNYPESIDSNENLYEVHDALRVRLTEDYNPGDTSITVFGAEEIMRRFSVTGIITLTEQCNEPNVRALSLRYSSHTLTTFDGLEVVEGFTDVAKPKRLTNVTQNVMAEHRMALVDAIINIEQFAGKKGEAPVKPLEGTMEQRITNLRSLALSPKAWFTVNKTVGLAPLTVEFNNQSFRLGTDGTSQNVSHEWDFGDNTGPSYITIEEADEVDGETDNVIVNDPDGGKILKTYTRPGIYDVTLTVTNDFGTDSITLPNLITARYPAPDTAVIDLAQRAGQILTEGEPSGGPYTTVPRIRAVINSLIDVEIPSGINSNTGRTYGGEDVDESNSPIDPIIAYTWVMSDDLGHSNSSLAKASFSVGGIYDLVLRVDTEFGAYRITTYEDCFDIVEKVNLWLWTYGTGNNVSVSEFGLISETFKTVSTESLFLDTNDAFLDDEVNEEQQKREFKRNVGFAQRGSTPSGSGGVGILYWASGRAEADPKTSEDIRMKEFNGFLDTYTTKPSITRPWNWVSLASTEDIYFLFGGVTDSITPNTSPTNQTKHTLSLSDLTVGSTTLANSNYKNGANELQSNEVSYDGDGDPEQGHMSVYRSAWRGDTGYIIRNEGAGTFFRLRSFYKTTGNTSTPFIDIRKLPDMSGPAKIEGQLVPLSQGVYFFNNSGSVSAYNATSGVWETGGPGNNSASFRLLQDTSVVGFDDSDQTLLAASDGDKVAYLSYDYSTKAFIKFNETDTTFSSVTARPSGEQWQIAIF